MEEDAQQRAEAIEEQARMDAKRLRTGAKVLGNKTNEIANNAKGIQQQSKRGMEAERRFVVR